MLEINSSKPQDSDNITAYYKKVTVYARVLEYPSETVINNTFQLPVFDRPYIRLLIEYNGETQVCHIKAISLRCVYKRSTIRGYFHELNYAPIEVCFDFLHRSVICKINRFIRLNPM
jgi:hypothetical protein